MNVESYVEHSRFVIGDVPDNVCDFITERYHSFFETPENIPHLYTCKSITLIPQLVRLQNNWHVIYDQRLTSFFDRLNSTLVFGFLQNLNCLFYEILSYKYLSIGKPILAFEYSKKIEASEWVMDAPSKNKISEMKHTTVSMMSMIMEQFVILHEVNHLLYKEPKKEAMKSTNYCVHLVAKELKREYARVKNGNSSLFFDDGKTAVFSSKPSLQRFLSVLNSKELRCEFYCDCEAAGAILYSFQKANIRYDIIFESILIGMLHLGTIRNLNNNSPNDQVASYLRCQVLYHYLKNFRCKEFTMCRDADPTWSLTNVFKRYSRETRQLLVDIVEGAKRHEEIHDNIHRPYLVGSKGEDSVFHFEQELRQFLVGSFV